MKAAPGTSKAGVQPDPVAQNSMNSNLAASEAERDESDDDSEEFDPLITDDDRWDVFILDDDSDPLLDYGDFWFPD